jgi:hypothetical protein
MELLFATFAIANFDSAANRVLKSHVRPIEGSNREPFVRRGGLGSLI